MKGNVFRGPVEENSSLFGAMSHGTRRNVIKLVKENERMSAGAIANELAIPRPTLSGHLNILKSANLLVGEREGTTIWYRVNLTVLEELVCGVVDLFGSGSMMQRRAPRGTEEGKGGDWALRASHRAPTEEGKNHEPLE